MSKLERWIFLGLIACFAIAGIAAVNTGPNSGGGSSSNTNAFTQANFDSSQFTVNSGIVSVKDAAALTNTVFKSGTTSAKAFSSASGTNFIRDAIRPAIQLSTDPANFAFELGLDTSGILKFYSADAVTNVLWLDGNGVNSQAFYLSPGSDAASYLALQRSGGSLLVGGSLFGYVRTTINGNDVLVVSTNQVTNSASLAQAGAQTNYNGLTMSGGQFTGNGAGLTNLPNNIVARGTVTLSSGTNKVSSAFANATNIFHLTYRSLDGSLSTVGFKTIVADTSFTIFSGNAADTNQIDYAIIKP